MVYDRYRTFESRSSSNLQRTRHRQWNLNHSDRSKTLTRLLKPIIVLTVIYAIMFLARLLFLSPTAPAAGSDDAAQPPQSRPGFYSPSVESRPVSQQALEIVPVHRRARNPPSSLISTAQIVRRTVKGGGLSAAGADKAKNLKTIIFKKGRK
ncbi:MAG: hypothetical protein GY874_23430 [Desulfobacteraceae bacterium]|nr:hypothetical protein [Desulfobacteraceae bacterium]